MAADSAPAFDVSVVIPARNEQARLPSTIERVARYLTDHPRFEAVVAAGVDSSDATVEIARRAAETHPRIRSVPVPRRGKGLAIRTGIEAAEGKTVITADADLSVDPDDWTELLDAGKDSLAIASRSLPGSVRIDEPRSRYLMGRAFNLFVRALVLPGVKDTQCGFKSFPRDLVLPQIHRLKTQGWASDVELLALCRQAGIPIVEIPVRWRYEHGGTFHPMHALPDVFAEMVSIRRRVGRQRDR